MTRIFHIAEQEPPPPGFEAATDDEQRYDLLHDWFLCGEDTEPTIEYRGVLYQQPDVPRFWI